MSTVVETAKLLSPTMGQKLHFDQPIFIQWDWNPLNISLTKFHVCIGTSYGNWDLVNGEVGVADRFAFITPPLPDTVNQIHILVLYKTSETVGDLTEEEAFLVGRVMVERA